MAAPKSKRKRRNAPAAPRAVRSARREQRKEAVRELRQSQRTLGTYGERPPSPFGGMPVSEILILLGIIAIVVWLVSGGIAVLAAGIAVCALGVIEFTFREHFSGYRSHTTLLAAIPAIAIGIAVVSAIGDPNTRAPLMIAVTGTVFALLFFPLRKRFAGARETRVGRGSGR